MGYRYVIAHLNRCNFPWSERANRKEKRRDDNHLLVVLSSYIFPQQNEAAAASCAVAMNGRALNEWTGYRQCSRGVCLFFFSHRFALVHIVAAASYSLAVVSRLLEDAFGVVVRFLPASAPAGHVVHTTMALRNDRSDYYITEWGRCFSPLPVKKRRSRRDRARRSVNKILISLSLISPFNLKIKRERKQLPSFQKEEKNNNEGLLFLSLSLCRELSMTLWNISPKCRWKLSFSLLPVRLRNFSFSLATPSSDPWLLVLLLLLLPLDLSARGPDSGSPRLFVIRQRLYNTFSYRITCAVTLRLFEEKRKWLSFATTQATYSSGGHDTRPQYVDGLVIILFLLLLFIVDSVWCEWMARRAASVGSARPAPRDPFRFLSFSPGFSLSNCKCPNWVSGMEACG